LKTIFDLPTLKQELAKANAQLSDESVWADLEKSAEINKKKKRLVEDIADGDRLQALYGDVEAILELAEEDDDPSLLTEMSSMLPKLEKEIIAQELALMLGDEADGLNAIMTINSGAGGTESQDWADMLLRMYLRYGEKHGYNTQIVDILPGEEAGIKHATITIEGKYAYGYLKAEAGVHRLVRISPYDSQKRRHTSFASVFVTPEIDESIDIEIDEKDLRVDTYRSSGSGGQHVNTTDSAVRLTHLPSGIVVACQNERSQHKNKHTAMKLLKSKLYELELEKRRQIAAKTEAGKKDISFGSQIRSYVLAPYRLAKDHRTSVETGNVDAVLDGDLDEFIRQYLMINAH
jgi:peptide chain release factor 2